MSLCGVFGCRNKSLKVDAVVGEEALVFCRHQGLEEVIVDGIVDNRLAVFVEELAHDFPVGRVNDGGLWISGCMMSWAVGDLPKSHRKLNMTALT